MSGINDPGYRAPACLPTPEEFIWDKKSHRSGFRGGELADKIPALRVLQELNYTNQGKNSLPTSPKQNKFWGGVFRRDCSSPHLVQAQAAVFTIGEEALGDAKASAFSQLCQLGFGKVMHIAQAHATLAPIQQVITGVDVAL